jgi:glycosyltransferase involved in cell wall biosynthesis
MHVHHLVDFPADFDQRILDIAQKLECAFDYTAHDYFSICPRFTLFDEGTRNYCGEPDIRHCQACVNAYGTRRNDRLNVREHRERFAVLLNKARQVFVPDQDVKDRLQRYLPDAEIMVRPHWDESPVKPVKRRRQADQPLRVVTVGGIAPHKGSHILRDCAKDAKERGLPIEYTLIGYSDIDSSMSRDVSVTGEYDLESLPGMLAQGGYDLAFFPAIIPETFNFTLSEVLHHGLFPVCFDIGAIARRVKSLGYGAVLPHEFSSSPAQVNDALLALHLPEEVPAESISAAQTHYDSFLSNYYRFDF